MKTAAFDSKKDYIIAQIGDSQSTKTSKMTSSQWTPEAETKSLRSGSAGYLMDHRETFMAIAELLSNHNRQTGT